MAEQGRLSVGQAAERLGVSPHRVHDYITEGWLGAEEVTVAGALRPVFAIRPEELERFEREWARGRDPRREFWFSDRAIGRLLDLGYREKWAGAGLSEQDVRGVVGSRIKARRDRRAKLRRGRPRQGIAPHHWRWAELYEQASDELEEAHRIAAEVGLADEPPGWWQFVGAVAERDWREHPEDWPRSDYPAARGDEHALDPAFEQAARARVSQALKRLQNARTENPAA